MPFQCVATDVVGAARCGSRAGRWSNRSWLGGAARHPPGGGDRRRPVPRRRHRQRRARSRRAVALGATHDLRPALRHDRPAPARAEAPARRRGAGLLGRPPPPLQARPRDAARRRGGHRAAHRRTRRRLRYNDFTPERRADPRPPTRATERFLDGAVDDEAPAARRRPARRGGRAGGRERGRGRFAAMSEVTPHHVRSARDRARPPSRPTCARRSPRPWPARRRRAAGRHRRRRWPGGRASSTAGPGSATSAATSMERYAAYRVGYHRGLDRLRANGWRGSGYVRWDARAEPRASCGRWPACRRAAAEIGEDDEAERCALFLRQLDPGWPPEGWDAAVDGRRRAVPRRRADRVDDLARRDAGRVAATTPTGAAGARSASSTTPPTRSSSASSEAVAHEYLHENYLNPFAFPSLLRMEQEVVGDGGRPASATPTRPASSPRAAPRASSSPCRSRASTPARRGASPSRSCVTADHRPPRVREGRATTSTSSTCSCRSAPTAASTPTPRPRRARPTAPRCSSARRPATPTASSTRSPSWPRWPPSAGVLCHVDACLGGWLLPFWERLGEPVPPWDLSRPGRHVAVGRRPQVRLVASRACRCCCTATHGAAAPPVLPLRRVARRALRLGHHRRHPPGRADRGGLGHGHATSAMEGYLRLAGAGARRHPPLPRRASRPSTGCASPATR